MPHFHSPRPCSIASRAILGLASATLPPSTLSLLRTMFLDPQERTFAVGVWIASFWAGGAQSPMLGGLLLEHFWWGSVFLVNVPVMLVLLAVGPRLLPEYRDPNPRPSGFDQHGQSRDLAPALISKVVVDTGNAYEQRDGQAAREATGHPSGSAGWAAALFSVAQWVRASTR